MGMGEHRRRVASQRDGAAATQEQTSFHSGAMPIHMLSNTSLLSFNALQAFAPDITSPFSNETGSGRQGDPHQERGLQAASHRGAAEERRGQDGDVNWLIHCVLLRRAVRGFKGAAVDGWKAAARAPAAAVDGGKCSSFYLLSDRLTAHIVHIVSFNCLNSIHPYIIYPILNAACGARAGGGPSRVGNQGGQREALPGLSQVNFDNCNHPLLFTFVFKYFKM
jgi:hypothetical protein